VPEPACFGNRAVRVMRQLRGNLQAHKPVAPIQPIINGPEEVCSTPNVFHGERFVDILDVFTLEHHRANVVVIVVAARNRLLKNRWIGSQAADSILIDQPLDFSIVKSITPEKIEPDALTKAFQYQ